MARKRNQLNDWIPPRKYAVRGIQCDEIPEEIWAVMDAKTQMWNEFVAAHQVHHTQYQQFLEMDDRFRMLQEQALVLQQTRQLAFGTLQQARQSERTKSSPTIQPLKQAYDEAKASVKVHKAIMKDERKRLKENTGYVAYREAEKQSWNASRREIYGRYARVLSLSDKCDVIRRFEAARYNVMKTPGAELKPKESDQSYIRLCDETHDEHGLLWDKLISYEDKRPSSSSSFRFLVEPPRNTPKTTRDKHIPAIFRVGTVLLVFQVVVHRSFPPESTVKSVILTGKKDVYGRWKWHIVFTLNHRKDEAIQESTEPQRFIDAADQSTGADVGWKIQPDGTVKVATLAYPLDEGYFVERIYLPEHIARIDRYLINLQQRIDTNKDQTKQAVLMMKDSDTWDEKATDDLQRWVSGMQKMGSRGLSRGIILAHRAGLSALEEILQAWHKAHDRLARERFGLFQRRHRALIWFYQQQTRNIVQRSHSVAIEKLPLDRMAQAKIAGGGRQRAALSIFRHWLKHYGNLEQCPILEVFASGTSQICAICGGQVLEKYKSVEYQMCEKGHTFNRDDNAAVNIANRGSKLAGQQQSILGNENPLKNDRLEKEASILDTAKSCDEQ